MTEKQTSQEMDNVAKVLTESDKPMLKAFADERGELEKFDAVVRKVFSVPKAEIDRREKLYQRRRKRSRGNRAKAAKVSR